jgi:ATP-dependent Lhr-like helicase
MLIPQNILIWFAQKNWQLHDYQHAMFNAFFKMQSTLLIAPTGGGKTLASFLPSLHDIVHTKHKGLHTLYISPLKALTYDIERNLLNPVHEMQLAINIATRTGDTPSYQRQRINRKPPHILLTTPESLLLMLSYPLAADFFKSLKLVIIDELHSFAPTKRGDLMTLGLARLTKHAPEIIRFGLSATVDEPDNLAAWLGPNKFPTKILIAKSNIKPIVKILTDGEKIPYSGIMAKYAMQDIYNTIMANPMTLIFVNTRAQAEFVFRQIWAINTSNLPIAIYHGSLNKEQRIKTEELTVAGKLRAIVATSALELGIDWGNVDTVIQINAPKGISRLLQRIGRSNHQFDQASKALLVPANCFEALECQSAIDAIAAGRLDGEKITPGSLDVVIQYIMNCACSEPFTLKKIYSEVKTAYPYRDISLKTFKLLLQFAIDGGYTLSHYERHHRLVKINKNHYTVSSPKVGRRHRQNIGTIIEASRLKVKRMHQRGGKILGDIEEGFAKQLSPGDTFLFAGEILEFIKVRDMFLEAKKSKAKNPLLPSYAGGIMPLTTYLAEDVRRLINTPNRWLNLPAKVQDWLQLQLRFSQLPGMDNILIEHFLHKKLFFTIIYTFEGRRANNTLGMLLTRRMEAAELKPLSFTISDYGLAITSLRPIDHSQLKFLLAADIVRDELEHWLLKSPLIKRTFRHVAIIAGLIERQLAGQRKSTRQVTFSTDLIYDVLMRYEPEHILLKISRTDVEKTLLDLLRLTNMLKRFTGKLILQNLPKPSPLSLPIMLALKTERIQGSAVDELLAYAAIEAEAVKLIAEVRISVQS